MKLLTSQRNELFQELAKAGLQPADFRESSAGPNSWYTVEFKDSGVGIKFSVRLGDSKEDAEYFISKRPGNSSTPNKHEQLKARYWNSHLEGCVYEFRQWAFDVKREIGIVNFWQEVTKAVQLFELAAEPAADKFTIAELGALHGQLRMLGHLFEASELLKERQAELAELTQSAAVKAETFTKKDWQNWIKGAFISAIASLELTEPQTQELLALIRLAFGGLFLK
ncbi:hypothetical protein [Hymenobacter ruricola]|uniref:DUF4304 domain-containing protein n=1 Tax=Hymenobacter ruricola TaxID=2791023 RepID=A0ABS0I0A7_9BACT|nr:hypothetical protein [Hymenobacter ruricola]MBF9220391.1 hypothetical protein [Hymenobacter ruricola]